MEALAVSWQPCEAPELRAGPCASVDAVLVPRVRDLGGFSVRRLLPSPERSPVEVASELLYVDVALAPGASLSLGAEHEERGLHLVSGSLEIAGKPFEPGVLLVLAHGRPVTIRAPRGARLLLMGGDRLDGPRHLWWNFVSSRRDRIEQAKQDWREKRFAAVPGETDFIPLPADA